MRSLRLAAFSSSYSCCTCVKLCCFSQTKTKQNKTESPSHVRQCRAQQDAICSWAFVWPRWRAPSDRRSRARRWPDTRRSRRGGRAPSRTRRASSSPDRRHLRAYAAPRSSRTARSRSSRGPCSARRRSRAWETDSCRSWSACPPASADRSAAGAAFADAWMRHLTNTLTNKTQVQM